MLKWYDLDEWNHETPEAPRNNFRAMSKKNAAQVAYEFSQEVKNESKRNIFFDENNLEALFDQKYKDMRLQHLSYRLTRELYNCRLKIAQNELEVWRQVSTVKVNVGTLPVIFNVYSISGQFKAIPSEFTRYSFNSDTLIESALGFSPDPVVLVPEQDPDKFMSNWPPEHLILAELETPENGVVVLHIARPEKIHELELDFLYTEIANRIDVYCYFPAFFLSQS